MYKKYSYKLKSGTEALIKALNLLNAKKVLIPTYTCMDIFRSVEQVDCEYRIVDCGIDLQIDVKEVLKYSGEYDTIIIPHMFGIKANIKAIKENTQLKIIEDLSQCHGLPNLGELADIVVTSTNKSKWIDTGGGGWLFSDIKIDLDTSDFNKIITPQEILKCFKRREELANEIKEAGVKLIGSESSWLRGMYFSDNSSREPYIPLHKIKNIFECPKVDSYIGKVNWISIVI